MSSPVVNNSSSVLNAKTLVTAEDNATITGLHTFNRSPSAPFGVAASSANVSNLDADMVDGQHASTLGIPTGAMVPFGGTAAPTGYLICDGSAVSRATFAALFAVLSTTYGVGDGSSTFNVPDMRQRFAMGKAAAGTGSTLGSTGGAIDHTHTGPAHTHTISADGAHTHTLSGSTDATDIDHTHNIPGEFTVGAGGTAMALHTNGMNSNNPHSHTLTGASTASAGSHSHTGATGSAGTGATGAANPPYLTFNYIIKT